MTTRMIDEVLTNRTTEAAAISNIFKTLPLLTVLVGSWCWYWHSKKEKIYFIEKIMKISLPL